MKNTDAMPDLLQGSGQFFPALISAFDGAQQHIMLETYIFDFTGSGQALGLALERAAQRGVRVQLVVDGVGTGPLPAQWQQRFEAAGVQCQVYSPLGRFGLLSPSRWRRLHRKLCVVDAGTAQALGFCGGINVLDDYYDPNHGHLSAPRFDFAVRLQGPLVDEVAQNMALLWQRSIKTRWTERFKPASPQALLATDSIAEYAGRTSVALVFRDNVRNRKKIEQAYRKAIGEARHSIVIANAYFLPGGKLRKALVHAAQRGIRVQLLLQGKYEYFMQYHAARPVFHALLQAGIEIYEYAPSFLHAKVAVVDAHNAKPWATVGSSNLDPLSLLLAREANVVVHHAGFAQDLHQRLQLAMQSEGQRMDPQAFAHRPLRQRALDWLAFGLMRLALWLTGKQY